MAHFIQQLNDRTVCVTISGAMDAKDRTVLETVGRALIAKVGKINLMVILKDFAGFARGVDWGNMEFYADHGDDIVKMAIVGDPKWKADAIAFTGSGTRATRIEFFPTTAFGTAHQWILAD